MTCRLVPTLLAALLALGIAAPAVAAPATPTAPSISVPASSGVWYEIFVRSWYDTNGDGIGDLNGVTAKLDYLKSLGVSGIWLTPINPSPSYHGYDITDYQAVNPQFGTLADFRKLTAAAHARGIRVIVDLVANHSSNEHPWFKAAQNPRDAHHAWYVWANPYTDLDTLSATGGKSWHAAADGKQNYLGIFVAQMPDLNYDNPAVRSAMIDVGKFWLKQGADGFRLDAAQHLYDDFASDNDNPQALAKNLAFWGEFRRGIDRVDPHAYLVGEVTRPLASELTPWFKPLDAAFNFPLAIELIKAAGSERNQSLAAKLEHTYARYRAVTGGSAIKDAPFLSNHDQERVMSQLGGNAQHMRTAAAMLLTLPGRPYVYYGEELGTLGKKPDPALREPMRWERATTAKGETTWEAVDPANGPAISVQAQADDPQSLLNRYRTLIHWRIAVPALRDGGFRAYPHASDHLAAWQRTAPSGGVLVVHNLSSSTQTMALDVPGEPHYARLIEQTGPGATIHGTTLSVPAYTSVVLQ